MALLFRFFVTDGERVGRWSALGGLLVTVGALGATLPALLNYKPCNGDRSSRVDLRAEMLANVLLLTVGLVPAAVSAIYKQSYLQQHSMSLVVFNAVLAAAQCVWGLCLAPLAFELQFVYNSGVQQYGRKRVDLRELDPGDLGAAAGASISFASSSHPASALDESLTWTDGVSRNLFVHLREGWLCIAGYNSEAGDTCEVSSENHMSRR